MSSKYTKEPDEDYPVVRQCQKGDKKAFEILIIKYQQKVFDQCYWMLLNINDSEDAAQDVIVKVLNGIKGFQGKSKFSTWLYAMTRNHCLNLLNSQRRTVPIDDEDQEKVFTLITQDQNNILSTNDSSHKSEVDQCVEGKITQLDEKYRSVVVLVHLQGLSYEEAAEILDCPIGTIRSRLNRALAELKPKLKECYKLLR